MKIVCLVSLLLLVTGCATTGAVSPTVPQPVVAAKNDAFADRVAKLTKFDGYLPLYWDEESGKLLIEIPRLGEEMIYQVSLTAGVGSNPIGLDRNQLGQTRLVRFERTGPRVLLLEINTKFRASTADAAERQAVADSFAQSVIAGFKVEAATDRSVLVDATEFLLSDAHGVARQLRDTRQGSYSLDRNRSAIHLPRTKAFPQNSEVEVLLTLSGGDRPGALVSDVTPSPESLTVRQRHSFVALPAPGFKPRRLDPRIGMFGPMFYDYASPFTSPLEQRWIIRHRLEKKDPAAAMSEPVEPIVYYVDNGVPEPIRSALVEGAAWWNAAFEAAGFRNAFQVRVLPPGADPMDVRYNVINWVHRSTRGWSYGSSVVDPRTGEIIKGHVLLGSLRIRQDVLLARGLVAQYAEPGDLALSDADPQTSPSVLALQRIRQLSAHEVGHTLGIDHNMGASADGRSSVMDYPAPNVKIRNGKLDLSDAYTNAIGSFDAFAIRYGYSVFPPGTDEDAALNRIAREAPLFVKDADARPVGGAHPLGSVWDNGNDPVAMLRHEIEVRRIALDSFGIGNLPPGLPVSSLEEMLLPLYLHHRYQLEAAVKSLGGVYFTYAMKENDGVVPSEVRRVVSPDRQRAALAAALETLQPSFLALPQRIIDVLPPRANGYEDGTAELFDKRTSPAFDPVAAASSSADITLTALLDPRRCARLFAHHAENSANPPMHEVTDALIDLVMRRGSGVHGAITRATRTLLVSRLAGLAAQNDGDPQVRAQAFETLRKLSARLSEARDLDPSEIAHRRTTRADIERFLARPDLALPVPPTTPPGPPI